MNNQAPTKAVDVRELALGDVAWSAGLHKEALAVGLFPALGTRFLRRYHRTFIDTPAAIARVATVDGEPVGFVVGVLDSDTHRRMTLRHHGFRLALVGVMALAIRPWLIVPFIRTRARSYSRALWRHVRPTPTPPSTAGRPRSAVLSHIAVDESMRGRRLGVLLVNAFIDAARNAGAERATTSTVDRSAFYESLGWSAIGVGQTFDGVTQYRLARPIDVARDRRLMPASRAD